ncbi:MAG: glycoside hydrolase family 3 C-terminal domain-containing protein [Erysipelotrichaceae bacterium]|nr:glycoside hydrolase family 3 C-terminal domain-containing protein [Erysipelotrichaceae bacterium]
MKHQDIISKMTLLEKVILTSGKNFWESQEILAHHIPSIFFADGPHGIRKQALAADHLGLNESLKATCFPTAVTIASSFDKELGEEIGVCLGKEALAQKVNVLLGPGLNIKRNPRCGRNFEYFSEDPYLAGNMAGSYVKGIQSNGISACLKHFACNSQEEKRMTLNSVVDERALREIYLTGFEIAVKEAKPKTIMSSYNLINGVYANENEHVLKEILRNEWGYDGVVLTDWGGENDRVKGLIAGNEMEMPGAGGDTVHDIMVAIKEGRLEESVLDENIDRLLDLILTTSKPFEGDKKYEFDVEKHHAFAVKCAEESMVLLKNEDNILPLKEKTKVALVGDFAMTPRYQGAGSSLVNCTKLENTLDIVKEYDFEYLGHEKGFHRFGKKSNGLIKKALKLASQAEVVVVYLGLDEAIEAEGLDRKNIKINDNQVELLKALKEAGKKVVGVLHAGSVVEMPWLKYCDALLNAYLPGQGGARAVLNVLTGKVNPSGKTAETYPLSYDDVPSKVDFPARGSSVYYRDSIFVGYRYYNKVNKDVLFPFGFGLSYSKFEYSDLKVDEKGVSFTITNSSDVDGKEIAQLYVSKVDSKIYRSAPELKGFVKVSLKAHESKNVRIDFDEYTYRFFDVKKNAWNKEAGEYQLLVGASSRDIRLEDKINIEGDVLEEVSDIPTYYSGDIQNVSDNEFKLIYQNDLPSTSLNFIKKNRIYVDYNTTVNELRYAKGWTGRFFSGVIRFAIGLLKVFGDVKTSNTLVMGVLHQPMRGLSRMTGGALTYKQLDGLIKMFNGHFFKGLNHFFKMGKVSKNELKEIRSFGKETKK